MQVPVVFEPMQTVRIGACLERAFKLYTAELGWFIGWGLAVAALSAMLTAATAGWAILLGLCLVVPTRLGLYAIADAAARGEPVTLNTALSGYRRGSAYGLGLLETFLLFLGLIAFVLPVFVVFAGLTWTSVALFRRDLGAVSAVTRSFSLSWQNLGLTLALCLIGFALHVVGGGTIVLAAVALPMVACLETVAFEQISPRLDPLL